MTSFIELRNVYFSICLLEWLWRVNRRRIGITRFEFILFTCNKRLNVTPVILFNLCVFANMISYEFVMSNHRKQALPLRFEWFSIKVLHEYQIIIFYWSIGFSREVGILIITYVSTNLFSCYICRSSIFFWRLIYHLLHWRCD